MYPTLGARQWIHHNSYHIATLERPEQCDPSDPSKGNKQVIRSSGDIVANQWYNLDYPTPPVDIQWRNKVKSLRLNLASYVGELDECIGLAESFIRRLINAMRAVRKRKLKAAFNHLAYGRKSGPQVGDISAAWLFGHFALSPILSDLSKGLNALPEDFTRDIIVRIHASASDVNRYSWSQTSNSLDLAISGFNRRKVKAGGYIKLLPNWSSYTWGNPLEAIWEGIPLSFVFDYILNVGDYLSSLDALNGVQVMGGTLTYKDRMSYRSVLVGHDGYFLSAQDKQAGSFVETATERKLADFGPSMPELRFENGASVKRLLHMLAIGDQLRRSSFGWSRLGR
jgi:hypothetical protein